MRVMKKDKILKITIQKITEILEELSAEGVEMNDFILGQKYAFIECLEILQAFQLAKYFGLDYDIEDKFPL